MEEKNLTEPKSGERRRSHGRRRRKNPNQNQNQSKGQNQSQNQNSPKRQERNRDRSRERKEREPKKSRGYQPDTGKDAIRSFDLGTCEEEGKLFVFHFDKGTYTIAERVIAETVQMEDGTEAKRFEDTEVFSTRDKAAAYKTWNEKKRPKKGQH